MNQSDRVKLARTGLELVKMAMVDYLRSNPRSNSPEVAKGVGIGAEVARHILISSPDDFEDRRHGGRSYGYGQHQWSVRE